MKKEEVKNKTPNTTYNFPQNVYLLQLVKDVIKSYILEQHPQ